MVVLAVMVERMPERGVRSFQGGLDVSVDAGAYGASALRQVEANAQRQS
jgi:hypothetical protein